MSRDCVGPRSRVGPLPLCETCLHGPCAGQCHRKDVQEKTGETYLPVAHSLTSCFPLVKACPQRVKLTHPGRTFRPLPQPLVQARKWWEKPESQGARRAGLALQRQPRRKSPDECSWLAPGGGAVGVHADLVAPKAKLVTGTQGADVTKGTI